MYWPNMIPQATPAPAIFVTSTVDVHGAAVLAGYLLLIAAMTLGLAILGLATRD